jgi:hypothetical protein
MELTCEESSLGTDRRRGRRVSVLKRITVLYHINYINCKELTPREAHHSQRIIKKSFALYGTRRFIIHKTLPSVSTPSHMNPVLTPYSLTSILILSNRVCFRTVSSFYSFQPEMSVFLTSFLCLRVLHATLKSFSLISSP